MRDEKPPRHPIFDHVHDRFKPASPDGIATLDEKARMEEVQRRFNELIEKEHSKTRTDRFLPYLVIRSVLNDNGTRPINAPFWESPDIWTAAGDPAVAPDLPANAGGNVQAGQATTVYAHVWNLGLAPVVGAKVEFYWFDPTFGFNSANARLIGTTSVDLPPRSSLHCHKLVKCRTAWVPSFVNGGHECLIARVSALGDPIGSNEWDAWANRHVAQRNITVVSADQDVTALAMSLEKARRRGLRVQLLQVGPHDGSLPAELLAPGLHVDSEVQTQILAEIDADGRLTIPRLRAGVGGLAADARAMLVPAEQATPLRARRIAPSRLLSLQRSAEAPKPARKQEEWSLIMENAGVADLLRYDALASPQARKHLGRPLSPPRAGEVQVLRLTAFDGDRLVGGYTLVVARKADGKR